MTFNTVSQLLKKRRINPLGFSVVNLIALQRTAPEVFEPIMRHLRERGPGTLRVPDELKETDKYQMVIAAGVDYAVERATVAGGRMIDLALVPTDAELQIKRQIIERNNRLLQAQEVVYGILRENYEKILATREATLEAKEALIRGLNSRLASLESPYFMRIKFRGSLDIQSLAWIVTQEEGVKVGNKFVLKNEHANTPNLLALEKENEDDYIKLFNALISRTVYGRLPRGLHATPNLREPLNWMREISARVQIVAGQGKEPAESYGEKFGISILRGIDQNECVARMQDFMKKSSFRPFDFAFLYDMELMFNDCSNTFKYVQVTEPELLYLFMQQIAKWGVVVFYDPFFSSDKGPSRLGISRIPFIMDDVELVQNRETFQQEGIRVYPTAHLPSNAKMGFYIKYDEPIPPPNCLSSLGFM